MSNVRPAPNWLGPARVDRLLGALDAADDRRALRALGIPDSEIDRLTILARGMNRGLAETAREIIRCSIAIMEGDGA